MTEKWQCAWSTLGKEALAPSEEIRQALCRRWCANGSLKDGQDFRLRGTGIPDGSKGMPNAQRGVLTSDHRGPVGDVANEAPGPPNWPQRRQHRTPTVVQKQGVGEPSLGSKWPRERMVKGLLRSLQPEVSGELSQSRGRPRDVQEEDATECHGTQWLSWHGLFL